MAWWSFGRKKRKDKKSNTFPSDGAVEEKAPLPSAQLPPRTPVTSPPYSEPPATAITSKDDPPGSPRSPVFEDARETFSRPATAATAATAKIPSRRSSIEDITALPVATEVKRSPHLRPVPEQETVPQGSFLSGTRPVTGSGNRFSKKPSKRKRHDPAREEQLRSMTAPIPIPQRSYGDPLEEFRRSSRHSNRDFTLDSAGSLARSPSVRSAMSGFSDRPFELGALELLSARPRIRHSLQGQVSYTALRSNTSRAGSKQAIRPMSSSSTKEADETIDQLADDYDANTLRQLMERDQKRRERKRKEEEDRARRRLERLAAKAERAEKDEAGPSRSKESARASRKSSKRDVKDSKDTEQATEGAPSTPRPRKSKGKRKAERSRADSQGARSFATSEYGAGSERSYRTAEAPNTPYAGEEPIVGLADVVRYSRTSGNTADSTIPPVPPVPVLTDIPPPSQARSQSFPQNLLPEHVTSAEPSRSPSAAGKAPGAIASFFRRSLTGKSKSEDRTRQPMTESSFTNVSRNPPTPQPIPAHLQDRSSPVSRASSGTYTRTKSRFREDLPETQTSGEDSRVGSPEILEASPLEPQSAASADPRDSQDTAAAALASAAPLSQSLASVDSEASWLSGRPRKRASQQMASSTLPERTDEQRPSFEDLGMSDDQYFRRLTPNPELRNEGPGGISAGLASSRNQAEAGELEIPEVGVPISEGEVARRPNVVYQQRVKSNEGLLNQFDEEDGSSVYDESDNPDAPQEQAEISEAAATTAMGIQHARTISGGSAKLLEIPKRSSLRLKNPPEIPKRSSQRLSPSKVRRDPLDQAEPESPTQAGAE